MQYEELISRLVDICTAYPNYIYFFEKLAENKHPKPAFDVDRMRMGTSARHRLDLKRDVGFRFCKELERLKLGRLEIPTNSSNARFHWDYESAKVNEVAGDVYEATRHLMGSPMPVGGASQTTRSVPVKRPRQAAGPSPTYVIRLASGQVLQLTKEDLVELREYAQSVL
jgi:hypothetical protein